MIVASRRSGSSVSIGRSRKIQRVRSMKRMAMTRNVGRRQTSIWQFDDLRLPNQLYCQRALRMKRLPLFEKTGHRRSPGPHRHPRKTSSSSIIVDSTISRRAWQRPSVLATLRIRLLAAMGRDRASRLRAHPTGTALLISEQTCQEADLHSSQHARCVNQRTYADCFRLCSKATTRPHHRKRLLNRRELAPTTCRLMRCPSIQKPAKKATVMLGPGIVQGFFHRVGGMIDRPVPLMASNALSFGTASHLSARAPLS